MAGGRAILAGFAALLAVPVALEAQTSGQAQTQSGGGYYDMGDYTYFNQRTAPTPTPTPTPKPSVTSAPALSVTQAPTQSTAQAAVRAQAVQQPSAQIQGQPYVFPKGDLDKARADAKALAKPARASAASLPTSTPLTSVPGYSPAANPAEAYADDPDGLTAAGNAAVGSNEAWKMVTDPDRVKVTLAPNEITRAQDVEKDPNSYLDGQSMGATDGSCKPLPPSGSTGYYEASCNSGTKVEEGEAICRTPLVVDVIPGSTKYIYTCENWVGRRPMSDDNTARRCTPAFTQPVAQGICRERSRATVLYTVCRQGTITKCYEPDVEEGEEITYECDSPAVQRYYATETTGQVVNERRNEAMCNAATSGKTCELKGETCVDPDPTTRTINGVQVTRACWNWERTYTCTSMIQTSDCASLAGNPKCSYVRDECLDDPQDGPCKVSTKVYKCPLPDKQDDAKQYICGDDVYCINGDCEPVEREASTEFKDAVVGLHALGQANAEFNENTLTLFSGTRETCNKKIFGASNCCSGKGVPLLTPWLCSSAEKQLDEKDDKGLCHKLGSYCSDKVLGICVTSKNAYCCFASKLTRILQEQGRPQLGKPWGSAKKGTCEGFTIDEFSRLNLSVMDFSEVVAEFTDAAKLPDELATSTMIQQRIKDYYETRKP